MVNFYINLWYFYQKLTNILNDLKFDLEYKQLWLLFLEINSLNLIATKIAWIAFFLFKNLYITIVVFILTSLTKTPSAGLKKFVQYVALFFWFDTFEGMPFFQQYFLAKSEVLGFGWTLFPIHFLP